MSPEFLSFLVSLGAVTLAEMGDKTQLLAMAFATKYKASKVLLGVFLATVLNHALAVVVGSFLASNPILDAWVQALASLSFIMFGLWTIHGDRLEGEENAKSKYGAVATVAIAFFLAEMGDKTQLTTIALAAKFPLHPVYILLGTTAGMLVADAVGIVIGVLMCKRIPERAVKLISAGVFILFGFIGSYNTAIEKFGLSVGQTVAILAVIAGATSYMAYSLIQKSKDEPEDPLMNAQVCRIKDDRQG